MKKVTANINMGRLGQIYEIKLEINRQGSDYTPLYVSDLMAKIFPDLS